jgi:arylsulfatase
MNWATLGSTPFRRFKHFTHEGGIAAPLIAHWPRGIPRAAATRSCASRRT